MDELNCILYVTKKITDDLKCTEGSVLQEAQEDRRVGEHLRRHPALSC